MINVLLVDDSKIVLSILKRILDKNPNIRVIGTAENGLEGLEAVLRLKPDVICSDYHMPVMDGLEFTRQVMAVCPTPILILSTAVQENHQDNIYQLLDAGAVAILAKPQLGLDSPYIEQELLAKIKVLSGVSVFRRKITMPQTLDVPPEKKETFSLSHALAHKKLLVIGASTGGPQAFEFLLKKLPNNYSLPIVCVQHISQGFLDSFISWLRKHCKLDICIVKTGDVLEAGKIYFAPDNADLIFTQNKKVQLIPSSTKQHHPSIDITFKSIAEQYGKDSIGILLTGMGRDGAEGLKVMADKGALTICQDEASSIVFGMPKVAIELGAAKQVLNLQQIANLLCSNPINHA